MSDPSPALFFETIAAYQRTAALRTAIETGLFTAVGEGALTAGAIAQKCDVSPRGARILADYMTALGFLGKSEDRYALTPDTAAFLDRRSPHYVGGAIEFLLSPTLQDAFRGLTAAVRTGTTSLPHGGTVAAEHPVWKEFARAMIPLQSLSAELLAKIVTEDAARPMRVLDIAAGHGMYGIAIARQNPKAEIVALDWPAVVEVAAENARAAGVGARHRTIPGSAFETDFQGPYDVVLITNFLHHFNAPSCEQLLGKVRKALAPGGRAATVEFIPNEDRVSPPPAAGFSLVMLATTADGDAYTFSELSRMLSAAGFTRSELHPLPPAVQQAVISYT